MNTVNRVVQLAIILIIAFVVGKVVSGSIQRFLTKDEIEWKGFYYEDGVYKTDYLSQISLLEQSPTFSTLQDCMKWGEQQLINTAKSHVDNNTGLPIITKEMLMYAHLMLKSTDAEKLEKIYQLQQNSKQLRGGFECSYGCRYEDEWQSIVCKDTTKMITELWTEGEWGF